MSDRRSDKLFEVGREAGEKYDYFLVGLSAALTAYLAGSFAPTIETWLSPGALEAAALLFLILSVATGIKRLETSNHALRANYAVLAANEKLGKMTEILTKGGEHLNMETGDLLNEKDASELIPEYRRGRKKAHEVLSQKADAAARWGVARDTFLVLGFAALFGSRLWLALS